MKSEYSEKNDKNEHELEGYIIDIVKKDGLVEIQTKNFAKIKPKLKRLLGKHNIKLVHNIPLIKWLIKIDNKGNIISRRKSPKKGQFIHIFEELIYITEIIPNEKFSLEIVMTEEEEIRQDDGKGTWRRKGISVKDRKLIRIIDKIEIDKKEDYLKILPDSIVEPFSTKDIANELNISIYLAQKVLYCFKKIEVIESVRKKGNLILYRKVK